MLYKTYTEGTKRHHPKGREQPKTTIPSLTKNLPNLQNQ